MSDIYESKLVKIKARRSFRSDIIWKFGPSSSYLLVLIAPYGLSTSLHLSIYQSVHAPVAVFAATGKPLEAAAFADANNTYRRCLDLYM